MTAPHRELELKAVVPDPELLRRRLRESGAVLQFEGRLIDVLYDRGGELTLRGEVLRARTYRHVEGGVQTREPVGRRIGPDHRGQDAGDAQSARTAFILIDLSRNALV